MAARNVRTPSAVRQQQDVERAADAAAKESAAEILRALRSLREGITDADILREPVRKALKVKPREFELRIVSTLKGGIVSGRRVASKHSPPRLATDAARAVVRPSVSARGAKWAERRAAELVTAVSESVRRGIREAVAGGTARGTHGTTLAREVRQIIGLDERGARAVGNFRAAQAKAGVDRETINARAEAYAERLLRNRADLIARTETFRAVNEGRKDLWSELVSEGVVEAAAVSRRWVSSRDERVDDICNALDGEVAGLDEDFPGGYRAPPDPHPDCRCTLEYVIA